MLSLLRELFFPDRCVGCGAWGRGLCEGCLSKLGGFKLYGEAYAFGLYEGVLRKVVLSAKYGAYGRPIVELLSFYEGEMAFLKEKVDLLVPVPEDPLRRRIFNHVTFLAENLARILDKGVSKSLVKVRPTSPQVGFKRRERETNIKGAFYFNGDLENKRVLLVDDVLTTGSTLRECSKALLDAHASCVYKLVIAVNL